MRKRTTNEILTRCGITREDLTRLYVEEEYSLPKLKAEYGLGYKDTIRILGELNIPTRSISEARKTNRCRTETLTTLHAKYGNDITNISQVSAVKDKKKKTFLKNYGVDNIWKSPDFYVWLDSLMLERHGRKRNNNPELWRVSYKKYWDELPFDIKEDRKEKRLKKLFGTNGCYSKLELQFKNYLDILNISYQHSFVIGRYQYDYRLIGNNILIEIQGDFWHANPMKYQATDILNFPGGTHPTADSIWKKDEKKLALANKHGYSVITFWESFLNNDDETILKGIFDEIKKHTKNSIIV